MTREIKFRAWDSVTKQMWTPDFISRDGLAGMSIGTKEHPNDLVYDFVRFPVMQFTGLKDKNGREIYEGDIIEGKHHNFPVYFDVEYGQFATRLEEKHSYIPTNDWMDYEVIGNIYENPELLKVSPQ